MSVLRRQLTMLEDVGGTGTVQFSQAGLQLAREIFAG